MAKSKAAKPSQNGPKSQNETGSTGQKSVFDKAMLEQLTAQIDRQLDRQSAKRAIGSNNNKRKRDAEVEADAEEAGPAAGKATKKQAVAKGGEKQAVAKGSEKQAVAKGGEKQAVAKKGKKEKAEKPQDERRPAGKDAVSDKKAQMLDEIRALGGDEADLELVDGIDSDAEDTVGGNTSGKSGAAAVDLSADAAFQSELAMFAAGLGFDKVRAEDAEEDEEEEEEGDDAEEEEPKLKETSKKEEKADKKEQKADKKADKAEAAPAVPAAVAAEFELPRNPKFSRLMLEPRPDWHKAKLAGLPAPRSAEIGRLSGTMAALKAYANTLLEADTAAYRSILSASSSHRFMSTIMSSGTMSDKVSALTLEIQEAPVHNTKAFENLLGLAGKRSRGQAIAALGALVDLLGNGVILPEDRRLRSFTAQPSLLGALQAAGPAAAAAWKPGQPLPGGLSKAHLVQWKYEDWLKDAFFRLLQQLEVWCNDEIEYSRSRALDFVYGLLRSKPEQEANLLRLLVNKLGDRERKIASRASYLVLQLFNQHPGMKPVVVQTIEQEILLRPSQSLRAKYYAINTLNQTILSSKEPALADTLVRVYFELFLVLLKSGALGAVDLGGGGGNMVGDGEDTRKNKKRRGHRDDKAAAPEDEKEKEKEKDKTKNTGNERDVAEKLVSALLTGVNRSIPFATADSSTLEKNIDTLFRITHSSNFNTSIQALLLVQQVAVSRQIAVERFYRTLYESLLDPRLIHSSKQAMYLNLLYRSLKNDVDVRRVKAFVKRMLQVASLHQPPFVCGILFMVAELETSFPSLQAMLNDPEANGEDEEEVYRDVVMEGDEGRADASTLAADTKKAATGYDGRKRDPEYSNAQQSCLWEWLPYLKHFHPSVVAFASNLLVRQTSLPKPDMTHHTLMHFLDKFVYRNAKATDGKQRGASIMQPVAAAAAATTAATGAVQIVAPGKTGAARHHTVAVNSAAFWNQKVEDVAAEDVFFHTYFSQMGKPAQVSRAAKRAAKKEAASAAATEANGGGDDGEEDEEDEAEEEIWQAIKRSRPEVHAGDGDDDDIDMDDDDDMSGLESLLNMSDSGDDDDDDDDVDDDDDDEDGGVEFADFADEEEEGDAGKGAEGNAMDLLDVAEGSKAKRERRKKMKALPMFASADDYAEMLGAEDDEDFA